MISGTRRIFYVFISKSGSPTQGDPLAKCNPIGHKNLPGVEAFSMFDFTKLGLIFLAVGTLYNLILSVPLLVSIITISSSERGLASYSFAIIFKASINKNINLIYQYLK